jgi:hypothetical protein
MPIDTSGLSGTLTATRTLISPLELATVANVNSVATAGNRYATATRPTNAAGSIVVAPSLNYIKFQTLNATGGHTLVTYVIGWTFAAGPALWIPSLLTKVTATGAATGSFAAGGGTLFPGLTYVKNLGDAKVYNGEAGSVVNGFVIVDVTGCELVELHLVSTASATNALINFI